MPIQSNSSEASKKLRELGKTKPEAFAKGLLKAGLWLQREAQQLTPVDTGALKSSAYTKVVEDGNPSTVNVEVGFTQSYGIYVHEDPNAHHPVGQYKFLEQPAREGIGTMTGIVTKEVQNG